MPSPSRLVLSCGLLFASALGGPVPNVALHNAALPGLLMPATGLGTGGYGGNPAVPAPECWSIPAGCGATVTAAVEAYLGLGGRRIDSADSYQNGAAVGAGIAASGVPREELFILSKVGPSNPLGYNDTFVQFQNITTDLDTSYVDALLIHWPWPSASQGNVSNQTIPGESSDVYCNQSSAVYDARQCRLNTWSALVDIFNAGGARSIGVSNYNVTHLEEIKAAGMPLPSIIQSPFHLYRSSSQMDVASWAWRNGVTFLGYSPFGVPDYHPFPTPLFPAANQLEHPDVLAYAAKYNVTPAQVLVQWQWQLGIPVNPRTLNPAHMAENLNAYGLFSLNLTEMGVLSGQTQNACEDDKWYECVPSCTIFGQC